MTKKRVLLFQPYLRVHILNFAKGLTRYEYLLEQPPTFASTKAFYKSQATSVEAEFRRDKLTFVNRLRRLFGIPNVRLKFTTKGDLLFTYGCLLLTNKPYCVYIENGAAVCNYDAAIARHPLARLALALLVSLPQCQRLIFMSQAAQQSFLATIRLPAWATRIVRRKAVQIYPLVVDPPQVSPKRRSKTLKLLFTGVFYMKGGIETLNAFDRLALVHPDLRLTVITPLRLLRDRDRRRLERTPGATLLDAALSGKQMQAIYRRHDLFLFPTLRDTFGLVLIEAMAWGLPVIGVDQYAVAELVAHNKTGLVYPDHPLTDYDRQTMRMSGRLYNAKDFYTRLFEAQAGGELAPIETFLVQSITRYLTEPRLLERHSQAALARYRRHFSQSIIARKLEQTFDQALAES